MLDYLFDKILRVKGIEVFVEAFGELPMPHGWTHIQNPAYHRHSYTYTDVGRVIALTPLVLRKFVNSNMFIKIAPLALIRQEFRLDIQNYTTCHEALTLLYLRFTQFQFAVFDRTPNLDNIDRLTCECRSLYARLTHCLVPEAEATKWINIPNFHVALHYRNTVLDYGSLPNMNSDAGERKHRSFKAQAVRTNGRATEKQLLNREITMQSIRSIVDGVWAELYPDLTQIIRQIFNTSPFILNGSLPVADILKCAATIGRGLHVSPPLILTPEGFDHICMWGHLRNKSRDNRFPSIASHTSPIRMSLVLAYQRQYSISIVSWPRNRFLYYNNMTVDKGDDARTYTIRAGQFVYHHGYGFGRIVCFITHEREYTRPFVVLAPLQCIPNDTDHLVSLMTYQQRSTLIVAGIPGLRLQRYYFIDSTRVLREVSIRRNWTSEQSQVPPSATAGTRIPPLFGFRQNYYKTRSNEGIAGTIY